MVVNIQAELKALEYCRLSAEDKARAVELIKNGKAADEAVYQIQFKDMLKQAIQKNKAQV